MLRRRMPRKPKAAGAPRTFVKTVVEVEGRREDRVVEVPAFEPAPWTADTPLQIVGARVPRMDAREKVNGRARYTADITRPGMLHAVIVRASTARGRIARVDATAARALVGVYDILLPGDAPAKTRLFGTEVLYHGQIGRAHV